MKTISWTTSPSPISAISAAATAASATAEKEEPRREDLPDPNATAAIAQITESGMFRS